MSIIFGVNLCIYVVYIEFPFILVVKPNFIRNGEGQQKVHNRPSPQLDQQIHGRQNMEKRQNKKNIKHANQTQQCKTVKESLSTAITRPGS